ncbi:Phenylserine dehydratase [Burkholderia gladioli]|uniref:threonine/serine dehydratase n=1 Tax=Burkholderia gladioli TaxID=28095 RepID=UPI0016421F61|nr:threonine/serine dehydratase [Burkholderia gladioli]CAG9227337.1 Phenylserine dehydratase [Burkholderia gladioli]
MSTLAPPTAHAAINGEPIPTLDDIAAEHFALTPWVSRTPVFERADLPALEGTHVNLKFELLQASGSFKLRSAFANLLALSEPQKRIGVTCVSSGNHATAVAYAAMRLGLSAKVVMLDSAGTAPLALCRQYGAEVVLAAGRADAFELVRRIEAEEGRQFIHPFNGYRTILGTATLGYEWATQAPDLDAVIVPVGGGGLAAGVATALRLANPRIRVYGVEPTGADVMSRSFAANRPVEALAPRTIADALAAATHTEEYSYELCRRHLERLVTVDDEALRAAMLYLFTHLKTAVEPACAAPIAALLGPLRETLQGRRVGVLLAGSNIEAPRFAAHLEDARRGH